MSEFDDDTAMARIDAGVFAGQVTDRWMIGAGPNGGYIASLLLRALAWESPQPDALTMTVHFVGRPRVGSCRVAVRAHHLGRSHAFLGAELHQGDDLCAVAVAAFGRRRDDQPVDVTRISPVTAAVDECAAFRAEGMAEHNPMATFIERFDYRTPADRIPSMGATGGTAAVGGWTRLVDRELDQLAVPLFADCWPPPIFMRAGPGMAPTIELTIHFRATPAAGWHWCEFASQALTGGYVEEDGEIWSADGVLVAQSRQLSRFAAAPSG